MNTPPPYRQTFEAATLRANRLTKIFGIYHTAIPYGVAGLWRVSAQYHPV